MIRLGRWSAIALAGLVVLAIGVHVVRGLFPRAPADSPDPLEDLKAWLAASKAHHQGLEKLKSQALAQATRARQLADSAQRHQVIDVARDAALAQAKTAADSNPILVDQRDAARLAAKGWRDAFAQMAGAFDTQTLRGDSLQHELDLANAKAAAVVPLAECHWLGIGFLPKCWSRTASAAGGAGVVLVLEVVKPKVHL